MALAERRNVQLFEQYAEQIDRFERRDEAFDDGHECSAEQRSASHGFLSELSRRGDGQQRGRLRLPDESADRNRGPDLYGQRQQRRQPIGLRRSATRCISDEWR
jgi:hypothetical protein